MVEENGFSWKEFFLGKIRRKLLLGYIGVLLILIILVSITYALNSQISQDITALKEVEAPLQVMVEQVIGYDAILTGNAHNALLHANKGEWNLAKMHENMYNEAGVKMDNLLKYEARELIKRSDRSDEDRKKVDIYLKELDEVNIALVDLEIKAFEAINNHDPETAHELIVSPQYHAYKVELSDLYQKWANIEAKISLEYEERITRNTIRVRLIIFGIGILFIIITGIVANRIAKSITNPVGQLTYAVNEMERGNFNTKIKIKSGDEFERLGNAFNKNLRILKNREEEHKQLDKAKTEFISITSHELRSPMTPMRAQLQMLIGEYFGKITTKQKESLDIVLRNTERLDKIITDFLEVSRIEAARLKFSFKKINLGVYIQRVVKEMENYLPKKKIQLDLKLYKLPVIEADPDRIMQVLRNLINNAKKFSPEGSIVTITAKQSNGHILISVADQGIGISEKDQKRIFEPFYQVEDMYQHKSGGTGLGLAISRGIIESQNGRIWVDSTPKKGSTFSFTVPLTPVKVIRPIKVLFSPKKDIEQKVKKIFLEILGPIGGKEFENLSKTKGITLKSLEEYIGLLENKGIINEIESEEFKNKSSLILTGRSTKVGSTELAKKGLIKKDNSKNLIKGGKK